MENNLKRITIEDNVCNGKPTIRGLRITVHTIVEYLLAGSTPDEILEAYPILEMEDIEAAKCFALKLMNTNYSITKTVA